MVKALGSFFIAIGLILILIFVWALGIANETCPKSPCGQESIVYIYPVLAFFFTLLPGIGLLLAGLTMRAKIESKNNTHSNFHKTSSLRILGYIIFALIFLGYYFTSLSDTLLGKRYARNHKSETSQNAPDPIAQLEQDANQGNLVAQTMLGRKYYYGIGTSRDYEKASKWINKAAEQGDAWAHFALGEIAFLGKGAKINLVKALYWSTKAAEKGFKGAYLLLGKIYIKRATIPEDFIEAFAWCNLSKTENSRKAYNGETIICLQKAKENLTPEELEKADELYKKYLEKYVKPFQ